MRLSTQLSAAVLVLWALVAVFAPISIVSANRVDLARMFAPPSAALWLGADDLGRAIGPRVLEGAAISCSVAFLVVAISTAVGTVYGLLSAWAGGVVDLVGTRVMDMFMAFPGILLAIGLAGILGPGLDNVVIALCTVSWVGFARLARAQTLSMKHREHVLVARALGQPPAIILLKHVLPLIAAPLIVEATFAVAAVVIAEAGLSFLGLGAQPPTPSWGSMIKDATQFLLIAPHMVLGPGVALLSLVVAVNVLGDRLRDRWQVQRSQ